MVDYHGLPRTGEKAWPGRAEAAALPVAMKGPHLAVALMADVEHHMGPGFDGRRFVPFVVVHEFEGLLFSDCQAFARGVSREVLAQSLQGIRDQFATPEDINDAAETAPSRRVEVLIPGYAKPLFGNLAALEIGLESITRECPHFRAWRADLEARASLELD